MRPIYTKQRSTKRRKPSSTKSKWKVHYDNDDCVANDRQSSTTQVSFPASSLSELATSKKDTSFESTAVENAISDPNTSGFRRENVHIDSPRNYLNRSIQTVEDFMDDEDINDWGGPQTLHKGYGNYESGKRNIQKTDRHAEKIIHEDFFPSDDIGKKLLRTLGWRERDQDETCVYLPLEEEEQNLPQSETLEHKVLSVKRVKRIQLKLRETVSIPPVKKDSFGIGHDPFKYAPEFKRYRELKQKRNRHRLKAATSSHGDDRSNVYRTSDLSSHDNYSGAVAIMEQEDDQFLVREREEDFIGTKSVGGFALLDDEDDVYDDQINLEHKSTVLSATGDYANEVFDTVDSDVEIDEHVGNPKKKTSGADSTFTGAVSVWASGLSKISSANNDIGNNGLPTVTSDGVPLLSGFQIGGSDPTTTSRWFDGPHLPASYTVQKHLFKGNNPMQDVQRHPSEVKQKHRRQSQRSQGSLGNNRDLPAGIDDKPLAGNAFSDLSYSLQTRFINSSKDSTNERKQSSEVSRKVVVRREIITWHPLPLLCKRFRVNGPDLPNAKQQSHVCEQKSMEQTFFQSEVLSKLPSSTERKDAFSSLKDLSEETIHYDKPPLEYMKAIFESDDDASLMSNSTGERHDSADTNNDIAPVQGPSTSESENVKNDGLPLVLVKSNDNTHVDSGSCSSENRMRKKHKKHRRKRNKSKKRKSSDQHDKMKRKRSHSREV